MIIFTHHASLKLEHRKIEKELVLETLRIPDRTEAFSGGRRMAFKKFKKLDLKVVFKREGKNIIIITQHWVGGL